MWSEKYGVRILEAYGATETSPALSANTPMHNKPGTVGRLLPGIAPRVIRTVDQIPLLGTGKTDYVRVQALVDGSVR